VYSSSSGHSPGEATVNKVMKLRVPLQTGNLFSSLKYCQVLCKDSGP
jgi:hypothetical protein